MYRFRKLVAVIWIMMALFLGFYGSKMPDILKGNGFRTDGSYLKTNDFLEKEFGHSSSPYIIVFLNDKGKTEEEFSQYLANSIASIEKVKGISEISSPLNVPTQRKANSAYALISFENDDKTSQCINKLEKSFLKDSDFETQLTGSNVIENVMNVSAQQDLKKAEMIGLPLALIVLLLAFGGLVAGVIPLITGFMSVVAAMGVCYFVGHYLDLSVFVLNVAPMIGLAVSIDFALLYIHRFREELKNHDVKEAVSITMRTAGRSIIFSGICVILGMCGMFFIDIGIFQSVAVGGIIVVLISVISAITFLPALLGMLGQRVNKLMIFRANEGKTSNWHRFASFVMKRPVIMLLASIIILLICVIPAWHINLEIPDVESLPKSNEARVAYERFEKDFVSKDTTQVPIAITMDQEVTSEQSLQKLSHFISTIKADKLVEKVDSVFSYTQIEDVSMFSQVLLVPEQKTMIQPIMDKMIKGEKTYITVVLNVESDSNQAKKWVKNWDEKNFSGMTYTVGGHAKFTQEIFDEIYQKAPYGLLLIICSTYLILLIAFRSVIIPLKAIIMNILSLSAAFGIIVWIFQDGHLGAMPAPIALMVPIFSFSIVFGLSMDYEVFLISRIHEVYNKTGDNDYATLMGLTSTGKIITSAAAIMIAVTGAFGFTDIIPVKQIGIGVALSILIDATIVRMILVPSFMKLLGHWNWWFPGIKRVEKQSKL